MEDNLSWNTTFDEKRPWMTDNLGWKTTLDERQPLDYFRLNQIKIRMEYNL